MTLTLNSVKRSLLVLTVNAACIGLPSIAAGQSASSAIIEEIVVTATKKKNVENVQDIPASISAFGANQLNALKVRDVVGLNYAIPNTSIEEIGTTKGGSNFAIRRGSV